MNVIINKACLEGEVTIPSSKSEAHRYLICAALSDGVTQLDVHGICSDIEATVDCLVALGAEISKNENGYVVSPIKETTKNPVLKCRDSGSTLRFLLPVAAAMGCDPSFEMEGRLPSRPLYPLDAEMLRHGTSMVKDGSMLSLSGRMTGNSYSIAANVSSQFVSGILMMLPTVGGGKVKLTENVESAAYIGMTVKVMREFGITVEIKENVITVSGKYKSPRRCASLGDWSGAAFWAAAGAISEKGITCRGVDLDSAQGDAEILNVLSSMGADVTLGDGWFKVSASQLKGTLIDGANIPDLIPVLSAAASVAEGKTEIVRAARLRLKESDRLALMREVLTSLGAEVTELDDGLTVVGKSSLSGGVIDSGADHRIAMSAAVAAVKCSGKVIVRGAECVAKSYPAFWDDFASLGADIVITENDSL